MNCIIVLLKGIFIIEFYVMELTYIGNFTRVTPTTSQTPPPAQGCTLFKASDVQKIKEKKLPTSDLGENRRPCF